MIYRVKNVFPYKIPSKKAPKPLFGPPTRKQHLLAQAFASYAAQIARQIAQPINANWLA